MARARPERSSGTAILRPGSCRGADLVRRSQKVRLCGSESPVYGDQEQSAYNGYFESVCYHPLFLFDRQGDCLVAKL